MLEIGFHCLVLREQGEEECSLKRFPKAFCIPSPASSRAKGKTLGLAVAFPFPTGSASNQHLQFGVVLVASHSGAASCRVSQAQDITACQDILQPPRLCQPCSVKRINLSLELSLPALAKPSSKFG